ncbi:FxsA family protein [Frigidibacter sp. SD6-1]|uniref:FxsA family protein n=1 Tax=Frigidibacter sp. SD6-1 TaxID=3032581 RepID=UPI0024DF3465|nr:FxsA family protein [Frigidibacter sp. SD6-1]
MWLFALFVAVPIIEIALFIQVGGLIGLWPTLALVLLTAISGSWLVREQGLGALADLQRSMSELRDPTEPFAHGLMILFAGLLLLTPGFFTDMIGIALLIRPVRAAILARVASRMQILNVARPQPRDAFSDRPGSRPDVVDGDFYEIPPDSPGIPPSGWTRH